MGRKTVALSLDEELYESYKKHCQKHSTILSRKIDEFICGELKKAEENGN